MSKENKKNISKLEVIKIFIFSLLLLLPFSIIFFFGFIASWKKADYFLIVFFGGMGLPFVLELFLILKKCYSILVLGIDCTVTEFYNSISLTKIKKKKKEISVEGIIDGKDRELLDKDGDGNILISEFYPLTESEVLKKVIEEDKNFSKSEFYSFVKSIFILINDAWSDKDYHRLRAFESDSLFYRHRDEIEKLIENNLSDVRENIKIKGVLLKDFKVEGNKEFLVVALTASMRKSGSYENNDYPYIMTFSRSRGTKTITDSKLSTTNCYNCGAVIDVSDDGICNYCHTSLVSGKLEWVLTDIKQIDLIG